MQDLQADIQTLFETFSAWAGANPSSLVLLFAAIPLLIIVVHALAGLLRRGAPRPEAEPPPPAAAVGAAPAAAPAEQVAAEPAPAMAAGDAEPQPQPEPVAEPEPAPPLPPPARLRDRLRLTSENLVGRLGNLIGGRSVDAEVLEELEMLLFGADLGVQTAESLLEAVRSQASGGDAAAVRGVLRRAILEKLERVEPKGEPLATAGVPHVVLVLGVNGSGKTTTIGKLAARYSQAGLQVLLGAGDTFRAAASEQLQTWGERVGCDVISGPSGGDPSAVAFDTVKAAVAREVDVAIIDTAGRLQTKKPLMEELSKLVRVIGRDLPGAPHECLLVLDSNTGQNAISQARLFSEVVDVTGLVLTKLDGTAKGGVLVGLADEFGIPVRYVGVGEAVEDLRDFSAEEFVEAVFEGDSAEAPGGAGA
jgi:fused signal recognition particle receptor